MEYWTTNSGIEIPKLGLGTWQAKGDDAVEAVQHALGCGYRHVDTAQIYQNEEAVGSGIKASGVSRDDIFLTTKVWLDQFKHDDVISSTEESLRKLKTDYLDLLLIHWPNQKDAPFEETLGALEELQQSGKTRLIGISNFTVDQMQKVVEEIGSDIVTNQVEYHPYIDQGPVFDYLKSKDLALTAYCPIAQGRVVRDELLIGIGDKYGKSPVQVCLRWLVQQPNVIAIPKSVTMSHIENNLDVFDFELTKDEMDEISELKGENKRLVSPDFAPEWDNPNSESEAA